MGVGFNSGESVEMFIRSVVSVAALVGLTACGGGGDSGLGGGAAATFFQLDQDYDRLLPANPGTTAPALGSGVVQFSGIMLVGDDLNPSTPAPNAYFGRVAITMDFDNNDFDGSATDFVYVTLAGTPFPTGLDTSEGVGGAVTSEDVKFVDPNVTSPVFSPVFSGTINGIELGGTARGEFLGVSADYVEIFENCATCTFEFGPNKDADVTIFAN